MTQSNISDLEKEFNNLADKLSNERFIQNTRDEVLIAAKERFKFLVSELLEIEKFMKKDYYTVIIYKTPVHYRNIGDDKYEFCDPRHGWWGSNLTYEEEIRNAKYHIEH